MNISTRLRITLLVFMILSLLVVLGIMFSMSLRQLNQLNMRIMDTQVEGYRTASELRNAIFDLNNSLYRYEVTGSQEDRAEFVRQCDILNRWVDEQQNSNNSAREQEVFDKIQVALRTYQASARNMLNMPDHSDRNIVLSELRHIEEESNQLFDLGRNMVLAHQEDLSALRLSLIESRIAFRNLFWGIIVICLILGIWVALLVYHQMIAPLRQQLVKTREVMERQEKLASLGVLAAGVAHEIRNPLTAIRARLFTLQRQLLPESSELMDAHFIAHEIDRLEQIVREVLYFARPMEPHFQVIQITDFLDEVRRLIEPHLASQHPEAVFKCEPGEPARILADPGQLKQALLNLIHNAAESLTGPGTIILRSRIESGGLLRTAREVYIEVIDTGKGISPKDQRRLFDPFFTTKSTGTGLGLAITARVVEKHGGRIQYQTQINKGTHFTLIFPLAQT